MIFVKLMMMCDKLLQKKCGKIKILKKRFLVEEVTGSRGGKGVKKV